MKRFFKRKGFLLFFSLEKEMKRKENIIYQPHKTVCNPDKIDERDFKKGYGTKDGSINLGTIKIINVL